MCRRCSIRKGLAVGKSTEMGSEAIKAWYEKQLNRLGLKENLMELFKAELRGTYMRTGPTFDFSKLKLTPRSHEWLQEYRRRHPNPVNLGKLICETEPIMTAQRSDFEIADEHDICVAIVKREPVDSPTVRNYRNAEGEITRTDYLNDEGEIVAIEEALDIDFQSVKDLFPKDCKP